MKYDNDVDKFVDQLTSQLCDRDDSDHVSKALLRLRSTLQEDGFSLTPVETESLQTIKKAMQDSDPFTIRAFRVSSDLDAEVVSTIFSTIDGWRTKCVSLKGRHYVVVSNAPRLSQKRIKTALVTLSKEKQSRKEATA